MKGYNFFCKKDQCDHLKLKFIMQLHVNDFNELIVYQIVENLILYTNKY